MEKIKKIDFFLLLFLAIVTFYCLVLSKYGFEFWDTGYITSFSWRVANGDNIYEDFIYKGPPATIYFHSIFIKILPQAGQFYFIRIINYLMFAIQVCFSVLAFYKFYKIDYNKWALMSVCFIISLLNFPPYPWPTTDGLFFASIALFFLSLNYKKNYILFIIAIFSIFSALTKQSYYPVPLFFLFWIFINLGYKKAIYFFVFLLLQIMVVLLWLLSFTSINKFIKFTTGETSRYQLLYSGFLNYFWIYDFKWLLFSILIISSIIIYFYKLKSHNLKSHNLKFLIKNFSIVLFLYSIILCLFHDFLNASRISFLSCCFGILFYLDFSLKMLQYYSTILLFLGLAWCSSISLGYPYPILFCTGIILTLIILFKNQLEIIDNKFYFIPLILLLITFAFSYTIFPYREQSIFNLSQKLDKISPKLIGLQSTKSNFEKLKELKKLKNKYGVNFIVAPNIPIAHYLFNSKSVLPADWLINSEINKNPKLFIDIASNTKNFIFLEKSFLFREELMPLKKEDFSVITNYIYKNFYKIDETKYFIIYNGINKK